MSVYVNRVGSYKNQVFLPPKQNTNPSYIRSVEGTKLRLPLGPPISSLSQRPMEHKVIHPPHIRPKFESMN